MKNCGLTIGSSATRATAVPRADAEPFPALLELLSLDGTDGFVVRNAARANEWCGWSLGSAGDVTTTFRLRGMRTYDLETRCRRADGSEEVDMGIARVQDPSTNAKLEWRFLPLALAWWPFAWTDYWIVDLAPDYGWALAAVPTREAMWILARKPELDAATYDRLVAKARALGFETNKLIRTRHSAP